MTENGATTSSDWKRCRVTGTLTLTDPLCLGDGTSRVGSKNEDGDVSQVACVARSANGRAMIPGSSLKGVLSEYLRRHNVCKETRKRLFGLSSERKDDVTGKSPNSGQGGSVEFGFAYSDYVVPIDRVNERVEQAIAIDRVTRAVADRQLFAHDIVPVGTKFDVELIGHDLTDDDLAALVFALEGFRDPNDPVRLGAGHANHFGRADWTKTKVLGLDQTAIQQWVELPEPRPDYWNGACDIQPATLAKPSHQSVPLLRFDIRLLFDGWFLVRDPRVGKDKPQKHDADAFPRVNTRNQVVLPRRGFRGVFRSQVERIARTLKGHAGGDPNRSTTVGIVEMLFGHTGGRAVVQCGEFEDDRPIQEVEPGSPLPDEVRNGIRRGLFSREFVAIDRFTGGASEHLKFNCVAAWQPRLDGFIVLDLKELNRRCKNSALSLSPPISPAAALGLLFLAMRDLHEGDLSFGMGAGKGFGQCRSQMTDSVTLTDRNALAELLGLDASKLATQDDAATPATLFSSPLVRAIAMPSVEAARQWLKLFKGAPQ